MENLRGELRFQNRMNNGKFLFESTEIIIIWNGMELEWK